MSVKNADRRSAYLEAYFIGQEFLSQKRSDRYPPGTKVFTVLPHIGKVDSGLLFIGLDALSDDDRDKPSMTARTRQFEDDIAAGPSNPFNKGILLLGYEYLRGLYRKDLTRKDILNHVSISNWHLHNCFDGKKIRRTAQMGLDGAKNFREVVARLQPKLVILTGWSIWFNSWMKKTNTNRLDVINQIETKSAFYDEFDVELREPDWSGKVFRLPHPTGRGSGLPWFEVTQPAYSEHLKPFVNATKYLLEN